MDSSKKEVVRLSLSGFMDEEYAFLDKYIAADPIYRQMFLNGKIPPFMADCLAAYKAQVLTAKPEPVVAAEWIETAARGMLHSPNGAHTAASVTEGWWTMDEDTLVAIMVEFARNSR